MRFDRFRYMLVGMENFSNEWDICLSLVYSLEVYVYSRRHPRGLRRTDARLHKIDQHSGRSKHFFTVLVWAIYMNSLRDKG